MNGLRSEFGEPQFEPHVTVVGTIKLSEEEARDKFRKGCGEVKKVYSGTVEKFDVGFVYLLLHPTTEVMEASARCCSSFGYNSASPYMSHMSLLYSDLTDEEKKKAQEKANILDEIIGNMSFQITHLALYKTHTGIPSSRPFTRSQAREDGVDIDPRVRLMYSANEGDIQGIKEILECGTDVNFTDIDHVAASHGSSDVVQLLLDDQPHFGFVDVRLLL
ncbi:hypothetical protein CQW23_09196 [Capsicum baccatum]|uniref:Cyclic phosphodiesterase n=1 Tax=Capsicum baccatum TaxID=33114 RepID=A0A2G2WWA2_CAPBA|nr:hypothetical protein CQW23_09196 [Capsicum baccatum]